MLILNMLAEVLYRIVTCEAGVLIWYRVIWDCMPHVLLHVLQEYAANPAVNWKAKDCAVYLVLAVTVKGKTGEKGATSTNHLVKIDVFFQEQVGGVCWDC
jgi:hypothetical protein